MLTKKSAPLKYQRSDQDAIIDAINQQAINVREGSYGAAGDDTGNDAPAIQAAINDVPLQGGIVYIPPGVYRVTSTITFPTDRQVRLVGAGRIATILHVPANTTASPGIIYMPGFDLGASVEDLQIDFDQPDTTVRTNMTHYVPAIHVVNAPRYRIHHVRIQKAWDGIDMRGNTCGEIIDLEMSHFNSGFQIDGALDSIRIAHLHDWPFGCTNNQTTASYDASNVAFQIGRADGIHISNALFLCGTGIRTFPSVLATGSAMVHISNCQFDTFNGLVHADGNARIDNCLFSTFTSQGKQAVAITTSAAGSTVQFGNCTFLSDQGNTTPLISLTGTSGGGLHSALFTGCSFVTGVGDAPSVVTNASAGGLIHMTLASSQFVRGGGVSYTAPTIDIGSGVRAIVIGNLMTDKGAGAGNFVRIVADTASVIADNTLLGWGISLPVGHQVISVHNNIGATGSPQIARGGEQQMGVRVYRTTAQAIANGIITPILFDAERNDASGWHNPAGDASVLVAPTTGWYLIGGSLTWEGSSTTGGRYGVILLNSVAQIAMQGGPADGVSDAAVTCTPHAVYYLNGGDTVQLCGYQTSGVGSENVVALPARSPEFWMARLNP